MRRILLIGAAILAFVCVAEARSFSLSGRDHQPVFVLQPSLSDDDDPELIRPGPRGADGEMIELRPPGSPLDDDEVVEALPPEPPGPQLDDDQGSDTATAAARWP
jgi:hypothetical protein